MSKNGNLAEELNYVTANRFYVEIEGMIGGCFTECSGIGVTIQKKSPESATVSRTQPIALEKSEYQDVTFKRGITDDTIFGEWILQTLDDKGEKRRNINILTFNQAGETMQTWSLMRAVPVGWKGASFQASSNQLAIEEITFAFEELQIKKGRG